MKEFSNINTGLPYIESEAYIESLLERQTAAAAEQAGAARWQTRRPLYYSFATLAVAASVLLAVLLPQRSKSPIDSFLASITDEEAALIAAWQIEDIPEY